MGPMHLMGTWVGMDMSKKGVETSRAVLYNVSKL
jgi:hypothetical protein